MKRLYKRIKHCFQLLFSDRYTVVIANRHGEDIMIMYNCCIVCAADRLDYGLTILEQIELNQLEQDGAVELTNRIINNN